MITKQAQKITTEELMGKALSAGVNWHHHCLSSRCDYNDTKKEIIVLELHDGNFYCESAEVLKKELEELAYQQAKLPTEKSGPVNHQALDLIKEYVSKKQSWHFHVAPPRCLLNHTDRHLIIVENDETKEKKQCQFDVKPVELIRSIDDYYLGRKTVL